ncbi:MAG: lactoylglutathione lyase [Alphaproteobacteria bacterium]|nr:lactoylglutathione lyase [Alphaproteobacteria bacterium]MBE8220126.1 lactoylglutathione lyase [Alphaproteobacteria bacterium]
MKYLHTMLRISDIDASVAFYCTHLGLAEMGRFEIEEGRFTLLFLAPPDQPDAQIELTYNWDAETLGEGRNFGHLAYEVENIYETCQKLQNAGIVINRPPRDGRMAFVRSPDDVSVELLQAGASLPPCEPWASMKNKGHW